MKLLDDLAKYSPLGSVLIIFLSYLSQYLYYSQFNIDISNYISLSEFIILFLKDSITIISILLLTLPIVLMPKFLKAIIIKIRNMKKLKKWLILSLVFTLAIIMYYLMIRDIISESNNPESNLTLVLVIFTAFTIILSYSIIVIVLKPNISKVTRLISAILFALILTSSLALIKSYKIKNLPLSCVYEIKQDNKTITTDENLVRIGQTENYFFLYNRAKETSSIIKTEDINEIFIQKK